MWCGLSNPCCEALESTVKEMREEVEIKKIKQPVSFSRLPKQI